MQKYQLATDIQQQVIDRIADFMLNIAEEYILDDSSFLVKFTPDNVEVELYND